DLGGALGGTESGEYSGRTPSVFFDKKVYATPKLIPDLSDFDFHIDPFAFKDVKKYLGDVLVEYAGALAFNNATVNSGVADVTKGVLSLSEDKSVLALDTSSVLWKDALGLNKKLDPSHIADFREAFFRQIDTIDNIDTSALYWLFGSTTLVFTAF